MVIGILKEGENRVSVIPADLSALKKMGVEHIQLESGAGLAALQPDQAYIDQGATVASRADILSNSDLLLCIHPPTDGELDKMKKDAVLIGQFNPLQDHQIIDTFGSKGRTTFSMELIPRTTRAQSMDVLSSMAMLSGYRAVLLGATHLPHMFPMSMTAAGSIRPAKLLVLGAGVAGLQAIATGRRLGAVVEAFDVRTAAREEVESLGAKFVAVEGATDDSKAGGYAVEQTEEYKQRQAELIADHAAKADVVICTAQIPGRKAPLLVTEETIQRMKPGSVVIDLAASTGGNCAHTVNGETTTVNGVSILGYSDLPSAMAADASKLLSKNLINFVALLIKEGELDLNFEDDIVAGTCLTREGELVNARLKQILNR